MKKKTKNLKGLIVIAAPVLLVMFFVYRFVATRPTPNKMSSTTANAEQTDFGTDDVVTKNLINLSVPFTPEAPDGLMVKPWNNSCEEASLVMLDEYYAGNSYAKVPRTRAKKLILDYIAIENRIFGYNANTNAAEMLRLTNNYSKYFETKIVTNPTINQIKTEITAGRPVIALVYGFVLNNPRIIFSRTGSYYHTFVIKGFDEDAQEFIVNDNGDFEQGLDLRYSYDTILDALADYNQKTQKTEKPATVLFSSQRILAKAVGSNKVYLIKDNQKHYISSPQVFTDNGWKWSLVQTVDKAWLDKFQSGKSL